MKLKNVNIFEQHVEKAILGLAVLFALYVVWSYVLAKPYNVTIAGIKDLSPVEVDKKVFNSAVELRGKASSPVSPLPQMVVPAYTEDFRKRLSRNILDVFTFNMPLENPGIDKETIEIEPPKPPGVQTHVPPTPIEIRVRAGHAVLAEIPDQTILRDVEQLIGPNRPRDFRYASVSAVFDMAAWREKLRGGNDDKRIPEDWWRGVQLISDVIVTRERLDPATGQWIKDPQTPLPILPGSVSYRDIPTNNLTQQEANQLIRSIRVDQDRIARPDFLPLANDMIWLPPEVDANRLTEEDSRKLLKLQADIKSLQAELDRAKAGLNTAPAGTDPGASTPGRPGAAPAPAPAPAPGAAPSSSTKSPAEERVEKLMKELENKIRERNTIQGLTDSDASAEVAATAPATGGPRPAPGGRDPKAGGPAQAQQGPGRIKVWFHDLSVKPGNTYRYFVRVDVVSPLFRKTTLPQDQKRDFFNRLSLNSAESEASAPITIEPTTHFFLANGSQASGTVTLEVWRIFNGKWRAKEFVRRPGDPIGGIVRLSADGAEGDVDMRVGAVVVDIEYATTSGRNAGPSIQMIYAMEHGSHNEGSTMQMGLLNRTVEGDKDNPKRQELRTGSGASKVADAGK